MTTPADPSPSDAVRLRSAVRGTGPSERIGEVVELLDETSRVMASRDELLRGVETITGLRPGELDVLGAVADGAAHPREVARRTGQVDAAAAATVTALERRGFLGRHHHESAPSTQHAPGLVHVSPRGRVALQQVEALQIRLLDAVADTLGHEEVRRVHEVVAAVQETVATGPRAISEGSRPSVEGPSEGR